MYKIRAYRNIGLTKHQRTVCIDFELPFIPMKDMCIATEHDEIIVRTVTFSLEENQFTIHDISDLTWLPMKEERDSWFKQRDEIVKNLLECGWNEVQA